jgi:hypothetical protein
MPHNKNNLCALTYRILHGILLHCLYTERITNDFGLLADISKTSALHFSLSKDFSMKRSIIMASLLVALSLTACDNKPTVVNVPVPGPTGATGKTGNDGVQGKTGTQGDQGKTGTPGDTTIIVAPPVEPAK